MILSSMLYKLFSIALLSALLFADAIFLGLDQQRLVVALISALSGSFVLTWYRQGISWSDKVIKTLSSSLGGFFIGAALNKYFGVESIEYFGSVFFLTSFLVLIFLRSLLTVAEKNATGIVTTIFQRAFRTANNDTVKQTKIITTEATERELKAAHEKVIADNTVKDKGV